MKLIQTTTLTGTQAGIEFTSVPQSFTDLVILLSARSNAALNEDILLLRLNSLTSGYTTKTLRGNGTSTGSNSHTTLTSTGATGVWGQVTTRGLPAANYTANTFNNCSIYFPNYTSSSAKTLGLDNVIENNASSAGQEIAAISQTTTSAITSIAFALETGSFVSGSTFSLYGITKGSDGIVTVS